ncbi:MAG: hemolysin family protein [Acidobacteriota bacterium]
MITELLLTGVALVVLVILSIVKTAYESLSEVTLRVMVSEREASHRARFFREVLEHRQKFELILVLGTQLSIALIAILLTHALTTSKLQSPLLIAFVTILTVILLFRQFVPRLIVQNRPERMLWLMLPPFEIFYRAFSIFVMPLVRLLEKFKTDEIEESLTEEVDEDEAAQEVEAFIEVAEEEGIIEEDEGELIQSVIEFGDTLVGEVMRPRTQIVAISINATVEDARRLIMEKKYSRIPVYQESIDDIKGIVYVRDLLAFCEPDKLHTPVSEVMRDVHNVPESKPIADLLEDMQREKVQMAIVIDEYGGVAGLITVEDMIEEVMGEIEDEDRAHIDKPIEQLADGSYELDGSTEIRVVENLFERDIEADDFTTLAGLLMNEMNRVPHVGEKLEFKGIEFEVVDADGQKVNRIRLRAVQPIHLDK